MKRIFSAVLIVLSALLIWQPAAWAGNPPTATQLESGFDQARPGFGTDHYYAPPIDHPMAYAMYTDSVAAMGNVAQTRVGAAFLVAHAHDNPKAVGWGLGFVYHACSWQTSKPNRANTIMTIVNALGIEALLNAYALTGDAIDAATAIAVLDDQLNYFTPTQTGKYRTGWFPYATSVADTKCEVFNILGYEMAVYARAASVFHSSAFSDIAARLHNELWLHRAETDVGMSWNYAPDTTFPRDLAHMAFIVHGFHEFTKYIGPRQDESKMVNYLATNYDASETNSLWGIGTGIAVLAERGRLADAQELVAKIPEYEYALGLYGMKPGTPPEFVRHRAFLLFGLATLEAQ